MDVNALEAFWLPLSGGILIGLAVSILFLVSGRVMGISGITNDFFDFKKGDRFWRGSLLGGLLTGGLILYTIMPAAFESELDLPEGQTLLAGLMVGFGTLLARGCTSGHGVCGLSRLSPRSLVATLLFISAGIGTVAAAKFFARYLGLIPGLM